MVHGGSDLRETFKLTGTCILHIAIGVLLFCCMAGAAYGVFELTDWLEAHGAPYPISLGCHFVGYFLFTVDVVCAGFFLLVEELNFLKEIWNNWQ